MLFASPTRKNSYTLFIASFFSFLLLGCGGENNSNNQTSNTDSNAINNQQIADAVEDKPTPPTQATNTKEHQEAFAWDQLHGWHTQGTVSRNNPIQINFNRDIIDQALIGKDASKVMHITPAIGGKPVFESSSRIVWTPTEQLKSGTTYKVSIKPVGLKDVPKRVPPFQFAFHVIPLEYEIKTFGLSTSSDIENEVLLKGQILVSDRVSSEAVKSVVNASQQGKALNIEWTHANDGKTHTFIISGIVRETFATDVKLSWNGKSLNIDSSGNKDVSIPSRNDFNISKIQVVHKAGSNPFVEVRFSDELDNTQNLKGLVELVSTSKYRVSLNNNVMNIYPNKNLAGSFKVRLHPGIKAKNNNKILSKMVEQKVAFNDAKPQVRFTGTGAILPENATLDIPFEAVGVNAVEVTAFKVYADNMGQFLQTNRVSGSTELSRSGRYLWRKVIPLTPADPNKWNRYSFNVTDLMKKHHGGLLRLTLDIKRRHSTYRCTADTPVAENRQTLIKNAEDFGVKEASGWDGISDYAEDGNQYDYDWNNRNNPCSDAYFKHNSTRTQSSKNFIASNIGLITKQDANGNLNIISTDIRTAKPLTGTEFEVRNFQGQLLSKATSDGAGFASMQLSSTPFLLTAKKFEDTTYLKLNTKTALAVSHFDVGGKKINKGIKGFIYGERGVWRPGDDIFLTFVLQNKSSDGKKVPEGHPVTMKLIDPRGRVIETKTSTDSVGGFYAFNFKTDEKAETGNWLVKAFVGGSTFSKSLMVETVRPNRLKLELSFSNQSGNAEDVIYSADGTPNGTLFSQWLHGATASDLKADVSVKFTKKTTRFGKYTDHVFDDPSRNLKSEEIKLLEGRLDNDGYLKFNKALKIDGKAAGMLNAKFTSRVFEKGGAFSISRSKFEYHPYENYVGIKLPKGDATRGMLLTDKMHRVSIASLNAKGEDVSLEKVQVSLYKIKWKWWWDKSSESLAEYADSKHKRLLQQGIVSTTDGAGEWQFEIKYPEWGRYLIRACDLTGSHCTGKTVYIDWPGWAGRAQEEGSGAASRLNLFSDKPAYNVGDIATIQLPAATQGRALLSVETGSQILEQRWVEFETATTTASEGKREDKQQFTLPITANMAPNVYVHITLLQPHENKSNDRPIRLYGIIPLEVSDSKSYLSPKLEASNEWQPESKQSIKVSEENGREMNYTLAVVDEGLLGLTAFKTPNLHRYFYSKEALGIKTWDLFDDVVGAYGGKLERMLALGGGDEEEVDDDDSKKRRFPPVVKYLGPFNLKAGASSEHEIEMPPYLGAVRVMLIAGDKGAYGNTQKSIFVRQPLMLQTSLPMVLGPDEEVSIPLTLFVMDEAIKEVNVSLETDGLVNVVGEEKQQINIAKVGEKVAFIKIKTANQAGKTRLKFTATAGQNNQHISSKEIFLDIRRANQETSRSVVHVIEPSATWEHQTEAFGLAGTNQSILELSSVPPLNLQKRLDYLLRYPHGCLEQTSSSAFPQLYLSNLMMLSEQQKKDAEHHVQKAIEKLQRFQISSGDFSYWPGVNYQNDWASIYAGHFLLEAKKQGYLVPSELISKWLLFQENAAQAYTSGNGKYSHTQAYRLYVLALAGKPQLGAMNRLREAASSNTSNQSLNNKARWLLASAYQTASQAEAATVLIQGMLPEVETVDRPDKTFSSTLGDLGLQLESLVALDKKQDANKLLTQIAEEMSADGFQSTQGIAWALMAVSRYLGGDTSSFSANLTQDGANSVINSDKAISTNKLIKADATIKVENTTGVKLFANLLSKGIPVAGNEISQAQGLALNVNLEMRDAANEKQWNDLSDDNLLQGTDARLTVSIKNTSNHDADNIALTIPVAAGMEILSATDKSGTKSAFDYRDVRDDRVHYYFPLKKGESKSFQVIANAAYQGRYYQPAINVEAMYDGKMKASEKGHWINIVKTLPIKTVLD